MLNIFYVNWGNHCTDMRNISGEWLLSISSREGLPSAIAGIATTGQYGSESARIDDKTVSRSPQLKTPTSYSIYTVS